MEAIELLGGMVNSMLEFPLAGFLGRLVPVGGSEAGQQVATAVGAGLDNLGSLCSQAGLDRWDILGLAVLSAITVYRKELSSNSVYNGKRAGSGDGSGGRRYHQTGGGGSALVVHLDGCHVAGAAAATVAAPTVGAEGGGGKPLPADVGKPCMCARIAAQQRQRASAAKRLREAEAERRLESFVAGRIRALEVPVNHLQQLRASVDASWSSLSTAWEARRARGSGSGSTEDGGGGACGDGQAEAGRHGANAALLRPGLVMPPCPHHVSELNGGRQREQQRHIRELGKDAATSPQEGGARLSAEDCWECATIAAHVASASLLGGGDRLGDGAATPASATAADGGLLLPRVDEAKDLWAGSSLGVLNADSLHRAITFLAPKDLLELAQVSNGAREAADSQLVWREVWWARFGAVWESEICRKAVRRWHVHGWNPKSSAVTQGWKEFFFEFEVSWLEWLAAGQNHESSCLVGVHGRLYNITDFIHRHPGSPETLMDHAGVDASEFFEDVGHSLDARGLMKSLESLAPGAGGSTFRSSPSPSSSSLLPSLASASRSRSSASGDPRAGACVLSSTAQRMRKERALAKREAKNVHAEACASWTAVDASGAATDTAVAVLPARVQEFVCEHCQQAFEPTDLDADVLAGNERRLQCRDHGHGRLHVFYSPVRREWGGFYSCCRKHVCFCIPTGH